jgi:hypothetical protein
MHQHTRARAERCDQCWQNAEGWRSDDVEVTVSAEEKRREHVGSERRGGRRGDGTGRLTDREETKKLKNSINISRRIVIGKRGWGGRKHRGEQVHYGDIRGGL